MEAVMKKITLALTASFVCLFMYAQTSDFVNQTEFQEKTKIIKSQVNAVRITNATTYKDVQELKSNVSEQNLAIKELREVQKSLLDSVNKTNNSALGMQKQLNDCSSQCNILTLLLIGAFIISILFAFSIYFKLDKQVKKLKNELENTNSMLIEQAKTQDKKISEVSHELTKLESELKRTNTELSKLKKE